MATWILNQLIFQDFWEIEIFLDLHSKRHLIKTNIKTWLLEIEQSNKLHHNWYQLINRIVNKNKHCWYIPQNWSSRVLMKTILFWSIQKKETLLHNHWSMWLNGIQNKIDYLTRFFKRHVEDWSTGYLIKIICLYMQQRVLDQH